jgi:hypothetical protein
MIIPRLVLLQSISPAVLAFDNAQAGNFWHNVLGEQIGDTKTVDFIVCSFRKKYLLMAPLGDSRKILARAEDGVHWSPPNAEFEVKLKNVKDKQTWKTAPTVRESGLAEFGSSVAGDNDSKPAAVLIYEYLVYLPDFPQFSPIILSLSRSSAKKGKDLNSKITFRNKPLQSMRFTASIFEDTGDEGPFFNWQFASNGWATEEEYERCIKIADQFTDYKVADETEGLQGGEQAATGDKTRTDI